MKKRKKKQKQKPAGYLDDCLKRLELVVKYLHDELKRVRHQTGDLLISERRAAWEADIERAVASIAKPQRKKNRRSKR